jgi:hypothetical protein
MHRHNLTIADLKNNPEFELIAEIPYSNIKQFIKTEVTKGGMIIRIYAFLQIFAILGFLFIGFLSVTNDSNTLWTILFSTLFSFTVLIILHEALHALAFLILGKKYIGFGAQWRKMLFYAESHHHVLDQKEMNIVALTPLLVITLAGTVFSVLFTGKPIMLFFILVTLIHIFFCAGDIAIVSYFHRHRSRPLYTYDDKHLKTTFYYQYKNADITVPATNKPDK